MDKEQLQNIQTLLDGIEHNLAEIRQQAREIDDSRKEIMDILLGKDEF